MTYGRQMHCSSNSDMCDWRQRHSGTALAFIAGGVQLIGLSTTKPIYTAV